jgi:UDP-N-acetylmuramoyl-tripeptide--D-alanyl-D-alanine ligase
VVLVLAVIITAPLDSIIKHWMIAAARSKLRTFPRLTVIGVVGSYGKTTMKEALYAVLSQKFQTVMTPENINTPLGIAAVIQKRITTHTQIFIVEMGEYTKGDIAGICTLVRPAIGVITGINEAHLERMGTIETAVSSIFELAEQMDQTGLLVLNGDSRLVAEHYQSYVTQQTVYLASSRLPNQYPTKLLGRYAAGVMDAVARVATHLGLSENEIRMGTAAVQPIPHRLQPIPGGGGVLVIDDSYNGNPDGVAEAIYTLSTFTGRRKIYITPGLVEMGSKTEQVHVQIGTELAPVADLVVLIQTSVTPFIIQGLRTHGFPEKNILIYDSMLTVQKRMHEFVRPHDVVLFQNDWPDNYV